MIDNEVLSAALEDLDYGVILCKVSGNDVVPIYANQLAQARGVDLDARSKLKHLEDLVDYEQYHNLD